MTTSFRIPSKQIANLNSGSVMFTICDNYNLQVILSGKVDHALTPAVPFSLLEVGHGVNQLCVTYLYRKKEHLGN